MSITELAAALQPRIAAGDFDAAVKFDCGDDGVLVIDRQTVSTEDQPTDCTIGVALEDLQAIADGDLDPTAAFMQGKLKVDGDMAVAMKLGQIL
ncbi:MAG: SCP2 sterol-binding domain-containing protein [Paracoccaceae bacterium]